MDEDTTKTTAKTLWTKTILEILYETLRRDEGDDQLKQVLAEVRQKGFKRQYIIDKVRKKGGLQRRGAGALAAGLMRDIPATRFNIYTRPPGWRTNPEHAGTGCR